MKKWLMNQEWLAHVVLCLMIPIAVIAGRLAGYAIGYSLIYLIECFLKAAS